MRKIPKVLPGIPIIGARVVFVSRLEVYVRLVEANEDLAKSPLLLELIQRQHGNQVPRGYQLLRRVRVHFDYPVIQIAQPVNLTNETQKHFNELVTASSKSFKYQQ